MNLDSTNTIYVCTDGDNNEVTLLIPRNLKQTIEHLNLSDRDPANTDRAEFRLLLPDMDDLRFEV